MTPRVAPAQPGDTPPPPPAELADNADRLTPAVRTPSRADAAAMLQLVRASGTLEPNSCYAYLLLCEHFRETCLVSELPPESSHNDAPPEQRTPHDPTGLAGFVAAYPLPTSPHTLFVWQVGVAAWAQRRGVGLHLLKALVARLVPTGVTHLEATVAADNRASRQLFASLARDLNAPLVELEGFASADFGTDAHPPEPLFRIGPFPEETSRSQRT